MHCPACRRFNYTSSKYCQWCGAAMPESPQKKKNKIMIPILVAVGVLFIVALVISTVSNQLDNKKTEIIAPVETVEETANESGFETIGMFDNSPEMIGISYYVTNPNKASIEATCNEMKARFIDSDRTTLLKIDFFDDRDNTPDYSGGFDIPESSFPCQVANYYYNSSNSATRLLFLKEIPER